MAKNKHILHKDNYEHNVKEYLQAIWIVTLDVYKLLDQPYHTIPDDGLSGLIEISQFWGKS